MSILVRRERVYGCSATRSTAVRSDGAKGSARIRPGRMGGRGECSRAQVFCESVSPDAGEPAPSSRGPAWLHWSRPPTLQSPVRTIRRMGKAVSMHHFLQWVEHGALSALNPSSYTMTRRPRWRLLQREIRAASAYWRRDRVARVSLVAARNISHSCYSCLLCCRIPHQ